MRIRTIGNEGDVVRAKTERREFSRAKEEIEPILNEGGVAIDLGGGKKVYAVLDLRPDVILEGPPTPEEGEIDPKTKQRKEVNPGIKEAAEQEEKKKWVFVEWADQAFKAAFPGRERFSRDLSDAPAEMRQSLIDTFEALRHTEDDLTDGERVALGRLTRITEAMGYRASSVRKAVESREHGAWLETTETEGGRVEAAAVGEVAGQAAKGPVKEVKTPAVKATAEGKARQSIAPRPRPRSAPQGDRGPRQEAADPQLERLRGIDYWLVSDGRGKGIGVKVAPFYKGDRGRSPLVGFKVLEVYISYGRFNSLRVGDMLQTDGAGNILDRTVGGFETQNVVPDELRTTENTEKLKKLLAKDAAAAPQRVAEAPAPRAGRPAEAPRAATSERPPAEKGPTADQKLERLREIGYWILTPAGKPGFGLKVAPWWEGPRGRGTLVGFKVLETTASPGQRPPLRNGDFVKVDDAWKLLNLEALNTPENQTKLSILVANDQINPEVRYGTNKRAGQPGPQPREGNGAST